MTGFKQELKCESQISKAADEAFTAVSVPSRVEKKYGQKQNRNITTTIPSVLAAFISFLLTTTRPGLAAAAVIWERSIRAWDKATTNTLKYRHMMTVMGMMKVKIMSIVPAMLLMTTTHSPKQEIDAPGFTK